MTLLSMSNELYPPFIISNSEYIDSQISIYAVMHSMTHNNDIRITGLAKIDQWQQLL